MEHIQRGVEHPEEQKELHEGTGGHGSVHHLASAQPQYQYSAQGGGELHGWVVARPGFHDGQSAFAQRIGALGEA